jgi:hypothetical protein
VRGGSPGMNFMPWVREGCKKPTARKRCRGYKLHSRMVAQRPIKGYESLLMPNPESRFSGNIHTDAKNTLCNFA